MKLNLIGIPGIWEITIKLTNTRSYILVYVKVIRGADIESDHQPINAMIETTLQLAKNITPRYILNNLITPE